MRNAEFSFARPRDRGCLDDAVAVELARPETIRATAECSISRQEVRADQADVTAQSGANIPTSTLSKAFHELHVATVRSSHVDGTALVGACSEWGARGPHRRLRTAPTGAPPAQHFEASGRCGRVECATSRNPVTHASLLRLPRCHETSRRAAAARWRHSRGDGDAIDVRPER